MSSLVAHKVSSPVIHALVLTLIVCVCGFGPAEGASICDETPSSSDSDSCWIGYDIDADGSPYAVLEISVATLEKMKGFAPLHAGDHLEVVDDLISRLLSKELPGYLFFYDRIPGKKANSDCLIYERIGAGKHERTDGIEDLNLGDGCDDFADDIVHMFKSAIGTLQSARADPYTTFLLRTHPDERIAKFYDFSDNDDAFLFALYVGLGPPETGYALAPAQNYEVQESMSLKEIASRTLGDDRDWRAIWAMNMATVRDHRLVAEGTVLSIPVRPARWEQILPDNESGMRTEETYFKVHPVDYNSFQAAELSTVVANYNNVRMVDKHRAPLINPKSFNSPGLWAPVFLELDVEKMVGVAVFE